MHPAFQYTIHPLSQLKGMKISVLNVLSPIILDLTWCKSVLKLNFGEYENQFKYLINKNKTD